MDKYLNYEQIEYLSPLWYETRKNIITSTKVAEILNLCQEKSNDYSNEYMTHGKIFENYARNHIGNDIKCLGLKINDYDGLKIGATPDGIQIVNGYVRLIEIKCLAKRDISYYVPVEYWVQMQIAMEVWDIDKCLYCEYKFVKYDGNDTTGNDHIAIYDSHKYIGDYKIENYWRYEIKRDKEWFKSILNQLRVPKKIKCRKTKDLKIFRNFIKNDFILDSYEKDYKTVEPYFQNEIRFKLESIEKFIKNKKYIILNKCIENLLKIYKENILIKYLGESEIFTENEKDVVYVFGKLVKNNFHTVYDIKYNNEFINFRNVKLDILLNGEISSKHKIESLVLEKCLIVGNNDCSGYTKDLEIDLKYFDKNGWENSYPNMKNKCLYKRKKIDCIEMDELTRVSYLKYNDRVKLHELNIFTVEDLKNNINIIKLNEYVSVLLGDKLKLPKIKKTKNIEMYIDFECYKDNVFLCGIYNDYEFRTFVCNYDNSCLNSLYDYIEKFETEITLYHWSKAEINMMKKFNRCVKNCVFVDLHELFKKNKCCVPGAYSYSLKDISKKLYEMGLIETVWGDEMMGYSVVGLTEFCNHTSKILNIEFKNLNEIKNITKYNYIDCKVMEEIRNLCL